MSEGVCLTLFALDNSGHLKHFIYIRYNLTRCTTVCLTKEKSETQRCCTSVKNTYDF